MTPFLKVDRADLLEVLGLLERARELRTVAVANSAGLPATLAGVQASVAYMRRAEHIECQARDRLAFILAAAEPASGA
jgi:hypothetical protein